VVVEQQHMQLQHVPEVLVVEEVPIMVQVEQEILLQFQQL
tara:strand:+ start:263 stop:382 length:120 start_codon:yes stop_codon:yes gene_type:complete